MKCLLAFLSLILLSSGCISKKEKSISYGPLSKIEEYIVVPLFLPNETSDKEILLEHLVELLGKLGTVHISTGCINEASASCAGLLISLGETGQTKTGSINIFADGEIVINKYKTSCEAWKTFYRDPTLPYPVDEGGKITFKQDPNAKSPDLKAVITQMLEQFAEQHRQDNPGSKPTCHVDSQMFAPIPTT